MTMCRRRVLHPHALIGHSILSAARLLSTTPALQSDFDRVVNERRNAKTPGPFGAGARVLDLVRQLHVAPGGKKPRQGQGIALGHGTHVGKILAGTIAVKALLKIHGKLAYAGPLTRSRLAAFRARLASAAVRRARSCPARGGVIFAGLRPSHHASSRSRSSSLWGNDADSRRPRGESATTTTGCCAGASRAAFSASSTISTILNLPIIVCGPVTAVPSRCSPRTRGIPTGLRRRAPPWPASARVRPCRRRGA
jgi:hypothetical protein